MATFTGGIPEKTIERLSEYRRTLVSSHRQGITHIFSHVLAGIHGITAVQVRRDLMLIGFSSDNKKGYDVKELIDFISSILDSASVMNIAVLGMGHLGQAITKYFNGKGLNLRITAAFDIDAKKIGKRIDNIPCYHMDTFEEVVAREDISIVIVSSPTKVAMDLVLPIINAGIKGVMNFTSTPLNFPQGIIVENYDITTLLEKVAYYVKESEASDDVIEESK
ncbi:MAG: redox-sensing transcriptional repressor Rex [Rikenellaceae bacterium]